MLRLVLVLVLVLRFKVRVKVVCEGLRFGFTRWCACAIEFSIGPIPAASLSRMHASGPDVFDSGLISAISDLINNWTSACSFTPTTTSPFIDSIHLVWSSLDRWDPN